MNKIPWCVVLTMINDQGRMIKKQQKEEDIIDNEQDELEFLGLA